MMYVEINSHRKVVYQAIVSLEAMDDTEPIDPNDEPDEEYVVIVTTNNEKIVLWPLPSGQSAQECVAAILKNMKAGLPHLKESGRGVALSPAR